jgi:hypothetical protein
LQSTRLAGRVAELGSFGIATRFVKRTFAILGLLAVAVLTVAAVFVQRTRAAEAAVWRELSQRVPAQALTSAEAQITNDALSARVTPEHDEVGHVQLPNGDTWRFAFRSHHLLDGPDSFSVFTGPLGTFRVRGAYFCCEVQFPSTPTPKDSAEFLAFLRSVHNSVEPAK